MTVRTDDGYPWAVRDYVEGYLAEDDVMRDARARGDAMGCAPIGPGGGAGLRFLAAAIGARAVVEIGTGAGVSGLWLLGGMSPDGVLTSIDVDPEAQRVARSAFRDAGFAPGRLRLINGMGLEVLPRLTDGGYDLVSVDASSTDYPRYLDEAVRLLRPGGVVAMAGVLTGGVTDPAADDPGSVALREVARQVRDDERLVPLLLPLGDGLLAAVVVT
ncbi:class I SAM-dependent methyltransferase [Pseudonocardia sp. KRD-184]|uniref:Class I SAM-dependent methyltransferase n=1 Tax=Pseudonocardia oceani TaxID=2792013 RepID=A0ABS6UBZ6_9PSEU|nr:class I SAM-dependent methyltransferase [Pseudonocardia oceani]MBW0091578.1 class I SAM-dependent methyltransferase [Pseudonocardia oceani]MBW0098717.1 class I SAM-dependent methyltransferase [Pseudonocardia oceani]MBW0111253.1 class I SAM-dependent methyltransferase [Pseudonocardia oceani]MBW0125122.1 class I SAM-dependent methyltransferase [Pseudonocardia oceani]MBW0129753.1 class I SAM-dependent methyltransferase [Pseudonocardia oceani]